MVTQKWLKTDAAFQERQAEYCEEVGNDAGAAVHWKFAALDYVALGRNEQAARCYEKANINKRNAEAQ